MRCSGSGPRATVEFLKAIRAGSSDMVTYHLNWARSSGINPYAAAVHEHRVLCDVVRNMLSVDQLDISNSLGAEIIIRRLIQIETATARSPTNPDYSGLDVIMEQPLGQSGEAQALKFTEWIGGRLKEKATIQKQSRLYKEEFSKSRPHDVSDDAPRGRGRGRGKPSKPNSKAAASSAAASTS